MLIKIGFDIELGVTPPTALIYMLALHPSRAGDLQGPEKLTISPRCAPTTTSTASATTAPAWRCPWA